MPGMLNGPMKSLEASRELRRLCAEVRNANEGGEAGVRDHRAEEPVRKGALRTLRRGDDYGDAPSGGPAPAASFRRTQPAREEPEKGA
eukprot:9464856-Alexandrium_andersonii.AAC.1